MACTDPRRGPLCPLLAGHISSVSLYSLTLPLESGILALYSALWGQASAGGYLQAREVFTEGLGP